MPNRFYTRVPSLTNGTVADANDVEAKLARVESGFDQVEQEMDQAIRCVHADLAGPLTINVDAAARADQLLAFSADGQAIVLYPVLNLQQAQQAASDAQASADAAAVSEANAATSEANAAASASAAATSEANAAASASAAASSAADAQAAASGKMDKLASSTTGFLLTLDGSGNAGGQLDPAQFQPADPDIPTQAATTAEMQAGTQTALRSMSPKNVADAIAARAPSTWDFESAEIQFTGAAGAQKISAAHGLGVIPKRLEAVARCLTASEGFSPGDEVSIVNGNAQNGSIQVYADAVNIYGLIYNQNYWWTVLKDGTSTAYMTAANWAVVLRAKK